MTIKQVSYTTRSLMVTGKKREHSNGFSPIHTDGSGQYLVTYTSPPDTVKPKIKRVRDLSETQFINELATDRSVRIT